MTTTEMTIISAQLPVPVADRLRELADRADRSLSAEVRRAVNEHLERETRSPGPAITERGDAA